MVAKTIPCYRMSEQAVVRARLTNICGCPKWPIGYSKFKNHLLLYFSNCFLDSVNKQSGLHKLIFLSLKPLG